MKKNIDIILNYKKKIKKISIDTTKSSLCFFSSSKASLGYFNFLRISDKKYFLKFTYSYLRNLFKIFNQDEYILKNNGKKKTFDKLFVTWAFKKNFDSKGNFINKHYFLNSSKYKKILWFIILMEDKAPKNISSNILLLKKTNTPIKKKCLFFIKNLIATLVKTKFNYKKFFHYFNSELNFSNIILNKLNRTVNFKNLNEIIIPYESQIFQNQIFQNAKLYNNKIKNSAYVYYTHPFPKELLFNQLNKIDNLYVFNLSQKKLLIKNLNWPKKKIKFIKNKDKDKTIFKNLKNKVFLPYYFDNINEIVRLFKLCLLDNYNKINLNKLTIQPHPAPYNKNKQDLLIKNLFEVIKNYKNNKINYSKNISIVIGLTSLPINLLKNNINFLHISNDIENEIFSNLYWNNLEPKKLNNNVYSYKKKNYNR